MRTFLADWLLKIVLLFFIAVRLFAPAPTSTSSPSAPDKNTTIDRVS